MRRKSKNKENYIEVGVAIIRNGEQFLVAKRPEGKAFGGKWEFPGGKIEQHESPEECLMREIEEEFGVSVIVQKLFHVWNHEYSSGSRFKFHSYLCEIPKGEPRLLWHEEMMWMNTEDLKAVDLLEADHEIIPLIEAL